MKLFKPLYIGKVDYTDVPHHKSNGWNSCQKRYINRIYIHDFAVETRLVEDLEGRIKKQCQWLIDYMFDNTDALRSLRPTGTPSDKVNGTKLLLAIGQVAQSKVRKDWASYTDAILALNTLYIYALEFRYNRECGYTDSAVVIGCNKYGWRGGQFVPPKSRKFGRLETTPNHRGSR